MCGISGLLKFDGQPVLPDELQTIGNQLAHRGRDHAGFAFGSRINTIGASSISEDVEIGLAHRRLSIIDLRESAAQPMFYADGKVCMTYNGEIYNYRALRDYLSKKSYQFKTTSDTEVLLAAYVHWGKDCVKHLNGMFAFAIWDDVQKHLFCARDPLGIKPFYYLHYKHFFAFASESRALSHLTNKALNNDALYAYFLSMYVPSEDSIFKSIHKLLPGHTLTINANGQKKIGKFWAIETFQTGSNTDSQLCNLDDALNKAVERQLISDVPVGGFLSGGIDSGLITALAAPRVTRYHTYSVGYEGLANNELPYAKLIAERYATNHTEVMISASDAMKYLQLALKNLSEPIADPAIVATYMLSELAAQDGVKVLLNGTGGDEVFAGYTRYTGQLSLKRKLLLCLPQRIKKSLSILPFNLKLKTRLSYPALDMVLSTGGSYALVANLLQSKVEMKYFIKSLSNKLHTSRKKDLPMLYQHMLFDLNHYLPDELLLLLDQMTMAHTVEGRVPLLDLDVIHSAFDFNAKAHIANGKTKALLKKVATHYLGENYVNRQKQGFAGSSAWWVQKNYRAFIDVVSDLRRLSWFENLKIETLTPNRANDIFILYCFAIWYENLTT